MKKKYFIRTISLFIILAVCLLNVSVIKTNASTKVKFIDIVGEYDMSYAITEDNNLYYYNTENGEYEKNELFKNVHKVIVNYNNTFIIQKDGSLWANGSNYNNQISSEDIGYYQDFIKIDFVKDVIDISGFNMLYVLKKDGTVWGWGNPQSVCTPIKIEGLKDIVTIGSEYSRNYALDKNGKLYTWNNWNEGEYDVFNPTQPKLLEGISDIVKIKGYINKFFAIDKNGNVYTNHQGSEDEKLFLDKTLPKNIEDIYYYGEMSDELCIVKDKAGKFYGKGDNFNGELFADNPMVIGEFKELKEIEGYKMSLANTAIDSNGDVKTWKPKYFYGYNEQVELDKIGSVKKAFDLSSAYATTGRRIIPVGLILTEDNQLIGYGNIFPTEAPYNFLNIGEEVGIPNIKDVQVIEYDSMYVRNFVIYVIDSNNKYYQISTRYDDNWKSEVVKEELVGVNNPIKYEDNLQGFVALNYNKDLIVNNYDGIRVIDSNVRDFKRFNSSDIVYINGNGKLVTTNLWNEESTKIYNNLQDISKIMAMDGYYIYLLTTDGKLISKSLMGANNSLGQLGNGSNESTDEFVEVKNINSKVKSVQAIDGAVHAVLEDGTVVAWGNNSSLVLGLDSNKEFISSPEKVSGLTNIKEIQSVEENWDMINVAITNDNKAFYWNASYKENISNNKPKLISNVNGIKEIDTNKILTNEGSVYDLNDVIAGKSDLPIKLPISNVENIEKCFYKTKDNKYYGFFNDSDLAKYLSSRAMVKETYYLEIEGIEIQDIDFDVNNDGVVNLNDICEVALGYNSKEGDKLYKSKYDFNLDKIIDLYDLILISKEF